MTYIERAISDFTRQVMVSGLRTLFTKRYLLFTLAGLIIVVSNSLVSILGEFGSLANQETVANLLLSIEIGIGIAFFLGGVLLGRFDIKFQIFFTLVIAPVASYLIYYSYVPNNVVQYFTAILFLLWIAIGAISQFVFFRDFFGNRISGGIIFLGKQTDDGKILFRGVIALITVLNILVGITITLYSNQAGNSESITTISRAIGVIVIFAGLINLLPLFHLQKKGDVFFTTLAWFYGITTFRVLYVGFQLLQGSSNPQNSLLDLGITFFLIIFAVHKAAKTSKSIGEEEIEDEFGVESQPHFVVKAFKRNGIFLMILGAAVGYHATTLQFRLENMHVLTDNFLLSNEFWSLNAHQVTIISYLAIGLVSVFLFKFSPRFHGYVNPDIFRLNWLPPYEDMRLLSLTLARKDMDLKKEAVKLGSMLMKGEISKRIPFKSKKETDDEPDRIESIIMHLVGRAKEIEKEKKGVEEWAVE